MAFNLAEDDRRALETVAVQIVKVGPRFGDVCYLELYCGGHSRRVRLGERAFFNIPPYETVVLEVALYVQEENIETEIQSIPISWSQTIESDFRCFILNSLESEQPVVEVTLALLPTFPRCMNFCPHYMCKNAPRPAFLENRSKQNQDVLEKMSSRILNKSKFMYQAMNNLVSRFHFSPSQASSIVQWLKHHRELFPEKQVCGWKLSPACFSKPKAANIQNLRQWLNILFEDPRRFVECKQDLYDQLEDFSVANAFLYVLTEYFSHCFTSEAHLKLLTEIFFKLLDGASKKQQAVQVKLILDASFEIFCGEICIASKITNHSVFEDVNLFTAIFVYLFENSFNQIELSIPRNFIAEQHIFFKNLFAISISVLYMFSGCASNLFLLFDKICTYLNLDTDTQTLTIFRLNRFCRNINLNHAIRGCPERSVWEPVAPFYSDQIFFHHRITNEVSRENPFMTKKQNPSTSSHASFNHSLLPCTPVNDSELSPFWKCTPSPPLGDNDDSTGEFDHLSSFQLTPSHHSSLELMENERIVDRLTLPEKIYLLPPGSSPVSGTIEITNFRFVFEPKSKKHFKQRFACLFEFSVHSIDSITIESDNQKLNYEVEASINLKDSRRIRLGFIYSRKEVQKCFDMLQLHAFPDDALNLRAFQSKKPLVDDGWDVFGEPIKEFERQGVTLHRRADGITWKLVDNSDFSICATYPRILFLPDLTKSEVKSVSSFRSKGRIPALTYFHRPTGRAILRSSQPLVGISLYSSRCVEDEKLLRLAEVRHILDARPRANAMVNQVTVGGGYENTENYPGVDLYFCGIENIHQVRQSSHALNQACYLQESVSTYEASSGTIPPPHKPTRASSSGSGKSKFRGAFSALKSALGPAIQPENTTHDVAKSDNYFRIQYDGGWLGHIQSILAATAKVVKMIHHDSHTVLVHCSDGWDRTSQMCALAQVLLDPYFRTVRGFEVLVEKDWLSFGHRFAHRCDHGKGNNSNQDRSPIFVQFLDCMYQISQQYPTAFEFNDTFLRFLADEVYSCTYGTFLFDSEKERIDNNVRGKTESIWTYVNNPQNASKFRNRFYDPYFGVIETLDCRGVQMKVWDYHRRADLRATNAAQECAETQLSMTYTQLIWLQKRYFKEKKLREQLEKELVEARRESGMNACQDVVTKKTKGDIISVKEPDYVATPVVMDGESPRVKKEADAGISAFINHEHFSIERRGVD